MHHSMIVVEIRTFDIITATFACLLISVFNPPRQHNS